MGNVVKKSVSLTSSSTGGVTGYIDACIGSLAHFVYTRTDMATTADITVTTETTAIPIWTGTDLDATTIISPRVAAHTNTGTAFLTLASSLGGQNVPVPISIPNERIKIVVAQGGSVKTGTFTAIVEGV